MEQLTILNPPLISEHYDFNVNLTISSSPPAISNEPFAIMQLVSSVQAV